MSFLYERKLKSHSSIFQTTAAGVEDIEVGFEEVMSWLPSHVLDESILESKKKKDAVKYHYHRHCSKLPTEPFPPASGGPGMQAFFIDSGQQSCGTGVFLPRIAGTNFQSSRRPACSPVLLPSRVVQALKLNVHELGLQISPRSQKQYYQRGRVEFIE
ncbi:hypothetical protein CRYUN_Cryun01aG0174400 [Craigia yunnanensis]